MNKPDTHADTAWLASTPATPFCGSTDTVIGGVIGAFDLFHVGHLRFLSAARQQCAHLKVGVGSDRLLHLAKTRAPVCDQAQRLEILRGLRCVDVACVFDIGLNHTEAAARWLADWPVNTVFVSSDWIESHRWQRLRPALAALGIGCTVLPYTEGISTTLLRQKVVASDNCAPKPHER